MINPNDIPPHHLHPIQVALLKHRSKLDEARASRLYQLASSLFVGSAGIDNTVFLARNLVNDQVSASCTDKDTGMFIQLNGPLAQGIAGASLTFGMKFCQDYIDGASKTKATKIW